MIQQLHFAGLGKGLVLEHRFHHIRRWRFDISWPEVLIAVEFDGLVRNGLGGHQTIDGVNQDCEKLCTAVSMGWRVMKMTRKMVDNGTALVFCEQALKRYGAELLG